MKEIMKTGCIQKWIYLILGIIIMMSLGTVYSWSVFRLSVEQLFHVGSTQSGLPYMVSLGFYALFMLLTGKYIQKYSPKKVMLVGSLLVSLGWILSAFAPNIYVLTITYGVIIGAGVGIAYGVPMTVIAKWFPEKRGFTVGLVLVGFGLSPLITAPLASSLIELYGLKNTFLLLGISFGIILPALSYSLKYPVEIDEENIKTNHQKTNRITNINTSNMVKLKSFKGLYLSFIIGSMIGLMFIGMTSNIGVELINLSPRTVTLLISMFAVFNGVGRPVFGWIADKYSSKRAILISFGLIITGALLMLMAKEGSGLIFSISFSIFWFNVGGWLAIAPTSTVNLYGMNHYSQNYGVVFTAYGIGAIIGVLGSGILMDITQNYYSLFYFVIVFCIIGIFFSQSLMKA